MKKLLVALAVLFTMLCPTAQADMWSAQGGMGFDLYDTEHGGVYRFEPQSGETFDMVRGEYADCTMVLDEEHFGYTLEWKGETAALNCDVLTLCEKPSDAVTRYNPMIGGMLPESVQAAERMNRALTLLPQSQYFTVSLSGIGSGTLPVYTAPSTKAYRAADGKASVGLRGEVIVLDWRDGWLMIFYELDGGKARVGWVQACSELTRALAKAGYNEESFHSGIHRWGRMPATAAERTTLTDNPNSQGDALMTLEKGDPLDCLGCWGSLFAYVETELHGKTIRGFVPLRDVEIAEPQEDDSAMAQLAGTSWVFYAGGNMFSDFQHYRQGGSVVGGYYNYDAGGGFPEGQDWSLTPEMIAGWETCAYSICRYDPAWGLFWADVPYMITYTRSNGRMIRYGLHFGPSSLTLYSSEGSGGYIPYTGALHSLPAPQVPDAR